MASIYVRALCYRMTYPRSVGLWGNRFRPVIAVSVSAGVSGGGVQVTEPGLGRSEDRNRSRQWVKYAITLLLLAAVVLTAALSSRSRDTWWEKYLSYIVRS